MSLQEQLTSILEEEREKEIIPFLKILENDQKKYLTPFIKKLTKEYFEIREVPADGKTAYGMRGSLKQKGILEIASFVCFNKQDFEKGIWGAIEKDTLSKILPCYCPSWFSEFINSYVNRDFVPFHIGYELIMELSEAGYIHPTPEIISKILPNYIHEREGNNWEFRPEKLLKREITLREHVWYLFEYENGINWSSRYIKFSNAHSEEANWVFTLKKFSEEGKIDRERLLEESLLASNRNFNKTLSGWFVELFIQLQPTKNELPKIQNALFIALNSPHSKAVNAALGEFKVLVDEKEFRFKEFIDHAPLLLSSETKSVVSSTIMILEKLLKRQKSIQEEILRLICNVFVHNDDSLQSKAAKIIDKYVDQPSTTLTEAINQFSSSLLINSKTILKRFLEETQKVEEADQQFEPAELTSAISEENRIPSIETFDDLLFLTSQAFDNNEAYHIDLLPATLIKIQSQITGKDITKLLPAFQRALKITFENVTSNQGYLDHLLAVFFIDYGIFLMEEFPQESKQLEDFYLSFMTKHTQSSDEWQKSKRRAINLEFWKTHEKESNSETIYEPYRLLLLVALTKIRTKDNSPLLSTPTHINGWICPVSFVERIAEYQTSQVTPDNMDFQIAISRCFLDQTEEALRVAEEKLSGELLNLVRFLFIKKSHPIGPFKEQSLWMIASVIKSPEVLYSEFEGFSYKNLSRRYLTGQFSWSSTNETNTVERYNYQNKQYEKREESRKVFRVFFDKRREKEKGLKNILSKLIPVKTEEAVLMHEYFVIKTNYVELESNDIQRLLHLIPNNPDPLLAQVIHKCLPYPNFWEVGCKKMVTKTIEALYRIWGRSGEMGHLFVATCMLSDDKTIRSFAAEIWIKGVNEKTIDSRLLGEIIGKHESIEFAPLKRFTDLVSANMFNISTQYNFQLEILIVTLLYQLPEAPINNLKKLLEIYHEVISTNNSEIKNERVIELLRVWKDSSSLNKVIKGLEGKIMR